MKRLTKKLTAVILALTMALSLTVAVGAAGPTATATVTGISALSNATLTLTDETEGLNLNGKTITLSFNRTSMEYTIASTTADGYDVAFTTAGLYGGGGGGGTGTIQITKSGDAVATVTVTSDDSEAANGTATITLSVTAAASGGGTSSAGTSSGGSSSGGTTTVTNADSIPQTGKSKGTGTNEGGLPSAVYDIVLPTNSNTIFDMILDPHSLLADTAYKKLGGEDAVNFSNVDGHLFFKNQEATKSGGEILTPAAYSGTSNELTVINRSWVDVETTLDLVVTKPTASETQNTFSFTDKDFKVSGSAVEGAGMYLAMVSTPTAGAPLPALSLTSGGALGDKLSDFATTVTDETLVGETITVNYVETNGKYTALTGVSVASGGYTATMDATNRGGDGSITVKKGADEIGVVTFTSDGTESADGAFTLTFAAAPVTVTPLNVTASGASAAEISELATTVSDTDLAGKAIALTYNAGTGMYAALSDSAFTEGYTASMTTFAAGGVGSIDVKKAAATIGTVTFKSSGNEATGTITLTFAAPASGGASPVTQVVGADGKAQIKTTIAAKQDLYKKDYNMTTEKYIYTLVNASEANSSFNKIDFNLTGKINDNNAWDKIAVYKTEDTGAIGVELTWTITEVTPPAEPKDPSVKVTTAAAAAAGNAVLTYDLGAGDKAMDEVESFSFKNPTGGAVTWTTSANSGQLNINTANKTITVTAVAPCFNGSEWTVNFKNSKGETKAVTVNIKVAD